MTSPRASSLIAVDIGNSAIKWGRFTSWRAELFPQPLQVWKRPGGELLSPQSLGELPPETHRWCVASVNRQSQRRLAADVQQYRPQDCYQVLDYRDLPLSVEVDFPERVGMDRLVAAVAANHLRTAGRPAIVIDAGTAITVDLVSAAGVFLGGAILPGFQLTARALSGGTDLLPLVGPEWNDLPAVVGKSTEAAIRSGLVWGTIGGVKELVERISQQLETAPHILVTGGDAQRLARLFHPQARFVPHLVLAGIALAAKHTDG